MRKRMVRKAFFWQRKNSFQSSDGKRQYIFLSFRHYKRCCQYCPIWKQIRWFDFKNTSETSTQGLSWLDYLRRLRRMEKTWKRRRGQPRTFWRRGRSPKQYSVSILCKRIGGKRKINHIVLSLCSYLQQKQWHAFFELFEKTCWKSKKHSWCFVNS